MQVRRIFGQLLVCKHNQTFQIRYLHAASIGPSIPSSSCSHLSPTTASEGDRNAHHAGQVVQQVVKRLQDLGHTVFLTPDYTSQSPIPVLLENGLEEGEVVALITEQKEHWLGLKGKQLTALLQLFASFQINSHNVILILAKEPKIFQLEEDYLIRRLSGLRNVFGLRTADSKGNAHSFTRLLLNCPSVFFNDMESYTETKSRLMNFFSSKEINYMLKNYPWILTFDPDQLELSYEYLHFVMGLEPREIASCNWYKHSLSEIHVRFKFVSKSGHYIKPHPKKSVLSKGNIPVEKILDMSDKHFAHLCNCSPEELEAFRVVYAEQFGDIQRIKDEIQHNARFKMSVFKRYENRKTNEEAEDDNMVEEDEKEADEDQVEYSPMDDRPIMVNKQWNEKREKRSKKRK